MGLAPTTSTRGWHKLWEWDKNSIETSTMIFVFFGVWGGERDVKNTYHDVCIASGVWWGWGWGLGVAPLWPLKDAPPCPGVSWGWDLGQFISGGGAAFCRQLAELMELCWNNGIPSKKRIIGDIFLKYYIETITKVTIKSTLTCTSLKSCISKYCIHEQFIWIFPSHKINLIFLAKQGKTWQTYVSFWERRIDVAIFRLF